MVSLLKLQRNGASISGHQLTFGTGMTKTYRLTYESVEVMHALFDKTSATQGFRISSRTLREYTEHFGPKTEQLDLVAQDGKVTFTSFTERSADQKGIYLILPNIFSPLTSFCRDAQSTT